MAQELLERLKEEVDLQIRAIDLEQLFDSSARASKVLLDLLQRAEKEVEEAEKAA